jgi:hypothetical protein
VGANPTTSTILSERGGIVDTLVSDASEAIREGANPSAPTNYGEVVGRADRSMLPKARSGLRTRPRRRFESFLLLIFARIV